MKEVKNNVIKKFKYIVGNDTYYIYMLEMKTDYDFYLQNSQYGIMSYIYGIRKDKGIDYCIDMIEDNILRFITIYKETYED